MPPIFRSPPPIEYFHEWATHVGLQHANDSSPFTKEQIKLDEMEQLLVLLSPYYVPCRLSTTPLTQLKALTIGRQLARIHGAEISSQEKTILGKKSLVYSIRPLTRPSIGENGITVEFK